MGLLFLVLCGAVLGWLAAIVMHKDHRRGLVLNVGLGVAGALAAGLIGPLWLGSPGLLDGTYSVEALLAALLGSIAVLLAANLLKRPAR